MSSFWLLFAANLVMTTFMAVVVALAGWWTPIRRHPRLWHALWLLVVAKLLAPPMFQFPVLPSIIPEAGFRTDHAEASTAQLLPPTATRGRHSTSPRSSGAADNEIASSAEPVRATLHSAAPAVRAPLTVPLWLPLLVVIALPAGILVARCLWQGRQIGRLVAQAARADGRLARIAANACRRLGLAALPEIRLVAGRLMPFLWVRSGQPTVVLPAALVEQFLDDQVECIVCHELAHFRRRDHWSSTFALGVAAAYWWFPVAWWARRELLAAQEQCCDALVIRAGGIPRRLYAETLFKTIEFINDERLLLPALASGFGTVSAIQRRFEMIAGQKVSSRFPILSAALALLVVGAFFSLPVFGQIVSEATGEQTAAHAGGAAAPRPAKGESNATLAELTAAYAGMAAPRPAKGEANAAPDEQTAAHAGGMPAPGAPGPPKGESNAAPIPVVEKGKLKYRTAEVTVDPSKHCLSIGQQAANGQGAMRLDLERGVTYTVSAAGKAFMSAETGSDADPFPGVVFYYSTDEEDGYAVRCVVLKAGDSVTFRTPSLISPGDEVFALAFFLDAWPGSENHGSYTLTFQRDPERLPDGANKPRGDVKAVTSNATGDLAFPIIGANY